VLIAIINLVRKKRLDEKFAFLWVVSGIFLVVAPLAVPRIDKISHAVGIEYPPALLFLIGFLALFLIVLQYSVILTRLSKQSKQMAQRLALMEEKQSHP